MWLINTCQTPTIMLTWGWKGKETWFKTMFWDTLVATHHTRFPSSCFLYLLIPWCWISSAPSTCTIYTPPSLLYATKGCPLCLISLGSIALISLCVQPMGSGGRMGKAFILQASIPRGQHGPQKTCLHRWLSPLSFVYNCSLLFPLEA